MDAVNLTIGSANSSCVETATDISVDGVTVPKADLAQSCDCGTEDKCWALAFSTKPWPLKLELCNHAGEPGHEAADSHKHTFSQIQMAKCRTLVKKAGGR